MTQDEIIELAKQANAGMLHGGGYSLFGSDAIERFAKLVAQHEREACAELCEGYAQAKYAAGAIRARGQA
jgi:hypothetical protein